MGSFKALTLSIALMGGFVTGAFAADMPPPPALMPAPMLPAPAASLDTSGWYLRGDIGIGATTTPKYAADFIDSSVVPAGYNAAGFSNAGLGDQMHIGFGAGYAVNSWFRADATLEYRGKANISGVSTRYYVPCGGTPCVPGNQHMTSDQWQGHTSSVVGLVNAYADLGTWSGITPYVGAGVGVASNSLTNVNYNGVDADIVTGATSISHNAFANKGKTNFAWALMAGVAYDISANAKLELGYRYLNMGKGETGYGNCISVSCGASTPEGPFKTGKLSSHDFRIGMRWMLNAPTPVAPAEPLVRKF